MRKKGKFFQKIKRHYRLLIIDEKTLEEQFSFKLSLLNVFNTVIGIIFTTIILSTSLIVFTPLKEFIPGYLDVKIRKDIIELATKVDSLNISAEFQENYITNLQNIIDDKVNTTAPKTIKKDSLIIYKDIQIKASKADSLFREQIQNQEAYNLSDEKAKQTYWSKLFFFPFKGSIIKKYSPKDGFFGIEVATTENEVIKSILDGTVIISAWTQKQGFLVQIQHKNNLISTYKYVKNSLKKTGDKVRAGDPIAVAGNDEQQKNRKAHVVLEIWENGNSINPEKYLPF